MAVRTKSTQIKSSSSLPTQVLAFFTHNLGQKRETAGTATISGADPCRNHGSRGKGSLTAMFEVLLTPFFLFLRTLLVITAFAVLGRIFDALNAVFPALIHVLRFILFPPLIHGSTSLFIALLIHIGPMPVVFSRINRRSSTIIAALVTIWAFMLLPTWITLRSSIIVSTRIVVGSFMITPSRVVRPTLILPPVVVFGPRFVLPTVIFRRFPVMIPVVVVIMPSSPAGIARPVAAG